jgi:hypothetical protein
MTNESDDTKAKALFDKVDECLDGQPVGMVEYVLVQHLANALFLSYPNQQERHEKIELIMEHIKNATDVEIH